MATRNLVTVQRQNGHAEVCTGSLRVSAKEAYQFWCTHCVHSTQGYLQCSVILKIFRMVTFCRKIIVVGVSILLYSYLTCSLFKTQKWKQNVSIIQAKTIWNSQILYLFGFFLFVILSPFVYMLQELTEEKVSFETEVQRENSVLPVLLLQEFMLT